MKYCILDLENIQNLLKSRKDLISSKDKVIAFYSRTVSSQAVSYIRRNYPDAEMVKISNGGKNRLDFNLVLKVGEIIGKFKGKELNISIISNDRGFLYIRDYLNIAKCNLPYNFIIGYPLIEDVRRYHLVNGLCLHEGKLGNSILDEILTKEHKDWSLAVLHDMFGYSVGLNTYKDIEDCDGDKKTLHNVLAQRYGAEGQRIYKVLKDTKLSELQRGNTYECG